MFVKIDILKNAASATFTKNRLQQRRFPVKFAKFLRAPSFSKHLRWLLLYILVSVL